MFDGSVRMIAFTQDPSPGIISPLLTSNAGDIYTGP